MAKPSLKLYHDTTIFICALLAGLPAVILAVGLVFLQDWTPFIEWILSLFVAGFWLTFASITSRCVVRPLQTMANLLMALREGDYLIRAHEPRQGDPLGDVLAEINVLSSVLETQRRDAVEAATLLRAVMEEIDVAVFAFDQNRVLRLVNRAGQELLGRPAERLLGHSVEDIGMAECLEGQPSRMLASTTFSHPHERWGLRRTQFRENGLPHQLVVIADLSQPLREEELKAWQRLVRVLGHELNNSLAPIKSIAGSLHTVLQRDPRPTDWEEDLRSGLNIIALRAEGLARFLQAYSQLARLPQPTLASCDLPDIIRRVVALESRLNVTIVGGPMLRLHADAAQIEQALINLLKNAVDATLEQRAAGNRDVSVRLSWWPDSDMVAIQIEDDGPGLTQTANLFVPFFTTKPEGSGIGLVLCRQIAENHGGSLELYNRKTASGCVALLRLPLIGPTLKTSLAFGMPQSHN